MPKYSNDRLAPTFQALADETRRALIERLARGPASMSTLAAPFAMSLPAVLQHLAVLESAGVVTSEKLGRVRTYQLAPEALTPCATWIGRQRLPAERRLDRLGDLLKHHPPTKGMP
ncbi:MAG: ArsR/SmtB family transcription factor [Cellulomonas sp.]